MQTELAETKAKSGGTQNGEKAYDHAGLDPQDFPSHQGISQAGYISRGFVRCCLCAFRVQAVWLTTSCLRSESVVGNSYAEQSTWGAQGRGIDMKSKAKLVRPHTSTSNASVG